MQGYKGDEGGGEKKIGQDENGEYEMKIVLTAECVLHASPEARSKSVGEEDKRMLLGWVSGSVCPSRARVPAKLCLHTVWILSPCLMAIDNGEGSN